MLKVLSVTFQTSVTQRHRGANNQPHGSQLHLPSCLLLPAQKRRTSCFWLYFTKAFLSFCRERSKIREAFFRNLEFVFALTGRRLLPVACHKASRRFPSSVSVSAASVTPPRCVSSVFTVRSSIISSRHQRLIQSNFFILRRTSFSRSSLDHGCIHLFLKSLFLNARWCNNAQYSPLAC